jgi:hypothetical protein
MRFTRFLIPVFVLIGLFVSVTGVQAGFGISPPYVKTDKPIFPGSHYEQTITLLRSSADTDMIAQINVDAPEISNWISLASGETLDLPKDKLQVPMVINVDVPADAEIGDYKGHINIRIVPKGADESAGVAIALGARVDIDLTVTNQAFFDFNIRKVNIPEIETLGWPWRWPIFSWLLYRAEVVMTVENTGNSKVAPSRVHMDVYDLAERRLIESHDDRSLKKVEPFATDTVVARFPTKLEPGQYWAKVKIYKDKEIVQNKKIVLTVKPHGELEGGTNLGITPWLMLLTFIALIAAFVYAFVRFRLWRYLGKVLWILLWPVRWLLGQLLELLKSLNAKFWSWVHHKTAGYQDPKARKRKR